MTFLDLLSISFKDVNVVHTPQLEQLKISELKMKNNLVRKIKIAKRAGAFNKQLEDVSILVKTRTSMLIFFNLVVTSRKQIKL